MEREASIVGEDDPSKRDMYLSGTIYANPFFGFGYSYRTTYINTTNESNIVCQKQLSIAIRSQPLRNKMAAFLKDEIHFISFPREFYAESADLELVCRLRVRVAPGTEADVGATRHSTTPACH